MYVCVCVRDSEEVRERVMLQELVLAAGDDRGKKNDGCRVCSDTVCDTD
jgi:hypothetical protein